MRLLYVTDGMADLRMIEGLSEFSEVAILAPSVLGDRVTNYWPRQPPAIASKILLPGGRAAFMLRAARWIGQHRDDFDVVVVLDNLNAALAATVARALGGPPVVLQIGRPTLDDLRGRPHAAKWRLRYALAWTMVQINERRASAIGAVSDYCAIQCRSRNRLVDSIPWCGVDTEPLDSSDTFGRWERLIGSVLPSRAAGSVTRVLFVDHETRLSGGQRDLVDLVRAFDPKQVELHAALPDRGPLADALVEHGVIIHLVNMGSELRQASRWELARRPWTVAGYAQAFIGVAGDLSALARELRPDVIHTNSMKSHVLAIPAARATRTPLVWHIRDILQTGWLQKAMRLLASVFADRVVSLSDVAAEPFRHGRLTRRVRVVHNGVRPHPFALSDARSWRRRMGAQEGDVLVVLAGQIARWKGQDVFVEAAALLAANHTNVRFAIVGECLFPENEGDFDESIRNRALAPDLAGRLVFTGTAPTIEPVMAAADIAVHASRLPEPFGRVIVEAMAQRVPVISTTIGAGPEIITEETGILVEPDDPAALAAAITALLEEPARRRSMGKRAQARAARFDISATAAGVSDVWDELR